MWGSGFWGRVALFISFALVAALLAPMQAQPAVAQVPSDPGGGVFVSGHDADFHARSNNTEGARNIIRVAIDYVTWSEPDPRLLVVTSRVSPGRGFLDPVPGIEAAGFTGFDIADDGTAGGGVLDLASVDFHDYDVVLVASDYGGWLRQGEVDVLNARSDELIEYINAGGGLVALAESGRLVTHDRYGFLPFLASDTPLDSYESGNSVTEFGASIGLTDADVNGNYSHNIFTETGGLEIVDIDADGNILSLATREPIDDGGVQPEPPPAFEPPVADAGPDQTVDEGSVVTLDASNSTASGLIAETYTTTSDFRQGSSVNLNDIDDQLRLDDTQEAFDFIWIAASGRGTVIKIDTQTGEILGEYWSAPQNMSKNPSRTTVDKDGNVWVGNRDESSRVDGIRRGSVSKIGLAENGQCVDRNGNGVIDTSTGLGDILAWPNAAGEDSAGGVDTATDECVVEYVRTNGRNIRQVSVDADNHVWVGGDGFGGTPRFFDRIAPDGEIVRSINMASDADTGAGSVVCCYGGLVDPNGILWSASNDRDRLIRIDPSKANGDPDLMRVINVGVRAYGMGVDPDGFIWLSNYEFNTIKKYAPDGTLVGTFPTGGPSGDRGVAVTDDGDVWVANSGGASVSRLSNSGAFVAEIAVGVQPTGVAVDPLGMVWVSNRGSNSATRIDPASNAVDLVVDLGAGAAPYNYSDMTGSTLSGAPDEGTWSVVFDSEEAATEWALIDWNADTPGDATVTVLVATSDDGVTYGPDVEVQDAAALSDVTGRHIRVTVRFTRSAAGDSPVLYDLSIARPGGDGELTYQWNLIDGDGPPVFLSSSTSATPSFVAPDDGTYLFELTVTDAAGLIDTDRVTVTVENLDPLLAIEPGAAFAGGVTLVNASFTDPGWLDTHSATVDWGDGTVDDIVVTAQGTGWGTFFGSHVFESAGTYAVTVTLLDDDGGSATASATELTVADPVAVWANSETASKTLNWSGASGTIEGRVHSNNELRFVGATKTVIGPSTYVGKLSVNLNEHNLDPAPVVAPVQDYPIRFDIADYRPGGPVAVQVGDAYHDMSSSCHAGKWHETQVVLDPGVYYADCDIQINGSNAGGRVTVVAEGSIKVAGSRPAFEPFYDGLLFLAGEDGNKAIDLAASSSKFLGVLFAEFGEISISGSSNRFFCGILGDTVDISGGDTTVRAANCGRPDSTVSGPLLVPGLSLEVTADLADVSPTETVTYGITISNDGALLVVPGLMGLQNVDAAAATVTGFDFAVEYFSIADDAWLPLAALGDDGLVLDTSANTTGGVTYPADGSVAGTTIDPDGLATWGFQALVSLSPEQVTMLLDPAVTGGIRNRVEFTTDPGSVQLRRLFTFGSDFIEEVRALSGDVTNVDASVLLPEGDLVTLDSSVVPELGVLAPGESVTATEAFTVAAPAPRGVAETDAGYLSRLLAVDGAVLVGGAFAFGTGGVGQLVAPLSTALSTEHVPVVSISTFGADEIPAGSTADYELAMANLGSLDASSIVVSAAADAEALLVTGAPSALVAGELGGAATSYTAPADAVTGPVAIRGEVTWSDANGVSYGPVGSTQDVLLLAPATVAATLSDTLAVDVDGNGFVSPGDTVQYTLTVSNAGGVPLTGITAVVAPDANSTLVVGSVQTDGVVDSGNAPGDTSVGVSLDSVVGGSSVPFTFDVTVNDPFPAGVTRLEAQGTVTADGFAPVSTDDPALSGATDPTRTTVVVPAPNLTAFMTGGLAIDRDGNGYPSAGDLLQVTVLINSVGSLPVTGVDLTVPTAEGTALVAGSVTTSVGTITQGSDVSVQVGTLAASEYAEISFDLDVVDPVPTGITQIVVYGTVTSNELDPLPTDDPDTLTIGDGLVIPLGSGGGTGPEIPGPTVSAVSPEDGVIITEPTAVTATLAPPDGEDLVGWSVGYRAVDSTVVTELATGTGAAVAAELDPTVLPNGIYFVVITAEASGGGVSVTESSIVIDGRLKLGRYVTTFQDMSVGVGGFPIQILRSYDSFDKSVGDFGVGWTLEIADFRVASNGPLGSQGWIKEGCGGGLIFAYECYRTERPHFVTVTWPDGLTEIFDLTPAQGSTFFPSLTSAEFTGRPNTTSTLEAVDSSLFWSNGDLLGGAFGTGGVFDPQQFRLTDRFGTEYVLDVDDGLLEMRDRNDNTLTITPDGITSSFGPGIDIARDGLGRIELITGPDGATVGYEYDANGDLQFVTDQNGNRTELTYLPGHYLDEILDPLNRPLRTLEYDTDGRLVAITDAMGNRTELDVDVDARTEIVTDATGGLTVVYTSDEEGNIVRVDEAFDGQVLTTTLDYNDLGLIVGRTDAAGDTWTQAYDSAGRIMARTDATAAVVGVARNGLGLAETVTDQLGNVTTYGYDAVGNLTSMTDAFGNSETYVYDARGNRISRNDRVGNTTTWDYDTAGRVGSFTDGTGAVVSMDYNGDGQVTAVTDQNGETTSFVYDPVGNLTSMTDPLGNTTVWVYDGADRLVSETDPSGAITVFDYDDADRLRSVTDAVGSVTTYEYDAAGRVTSVTDPLGAVTVSSYDGAGRLVGSTNALGETTVFERDVTGRAVGVTDPLGNMSTTTYDPMGRILATTSASGSVTAYSYDARGLLESVSDAIGNTTVHTYDVVGLLETTTDARGNTTGYSYDAAGRLEQLADAGGGAVTFGYDGVGRTTSIVDPNGVTRTMAYDPAGNVVSSTDPFGGVASYSHDPLGRILSLTDARGVTVGFGYDANGRLDQVATPDGPVEYEYDLLGRRIAMTDPTGATTWGYDAASRVVEVAAPQGTVGYTYDGAGRRIGMTLPEGQIDYGYDAAGRLASLMDWNGDVTGFTVNADGLRTGISRPNGVETAFGYDDALRQTSVAHTGPSGLIDSFEYVLDGNGNRTSVSSSAGTETYTIDDLNRLTEVSFPDGDTTSYSYDAAGNRLTETVNGSVSTYSYDTNGLLTTVGPDSVSYDAEANTTGLGTDTFEYDWAGRLVGATVDGAASTYSYDGDGVRVASTTGGVGNAYVWDRVGAWPLLVADADASYLHSGGVLAEVGTGSTLYPLTDVLGSVRAVADAVGTVAGTSDFDAFGQVRTSTGTSSVFGFSGEQTDASGLVFLRARYYNPTLGRLLTPDVVQPNAPGTQGYNLYTYTANNPTTWTDPTGNAVLIEYSVRAAAAGAIIGGAFGFKFCDETALFDVSFGDSYPGCILRSGLAGAAGGAFYFSGGGFWAALGTGAVGGFTSGTVFEGTGALTSDQDFDLGRVVQDTLLGAITSGIIWGGGRIWQGLHAPPAPSGLRGRAAELLGPSDNVVVLGRLPDTAAYNGRPGHTVLDADDWSPPLNDAFIEELIAQQRTVYLASAVEGNLIQTAGEYIGQPTIFARELAMLDAAGYTLVGDYLVPPG